MKKPYIYVLLTIVLWSFSTYLARLISVKSQFALMCLAFFFTFITQAAYYFLDNRKDLITKLKAVKPVYFFIGLFGYFVYWAALIQSFRAYNSASEPTILNYTWPIFTVIFTELLFRDNSKKNVIQKVVESTGVIIGFSAIFMLATKGRIFTFDFYNIEGLLWGLLAGASYGFYSGYSGTVSKDDHSLFLMISIFVSLIFMAGLSFSELHVIKTFTLKDFLIVFILGSLIDGIGYITWTKANRLSFEQKINISSVVSLVFALPLLSLTVVTVLLKETALFESYFITSMVMIILSMIICVKSENIFEYIKKRVS